MKTQYIVVLSMLAGAAFGVAAVQGLHAQAKPPVYYVGEADVTDPDGYGKEYAPKARAIIEAAGGKYLAMAGAAASSKVVAIEGEPPKRATVIVWASIEKLKAWRNSAEFIESRKVGDQYAKFRSFAVEGLPQ